MFLLPDAIKARGAATGTEWAGWLTIGAGQFCANPGIAVVIDGVDADAFIGSAKSALAKVGPQVMLTDDIAAACQSGNARFDRSDALTR